MTKTKLHVNEFVETFYTKTYSKGGLTSPPFLCKIIRDNTIFLMDKEKLKLIVKNLESLVECLKSVVYSDLDAYRPNYEEIAPHISDYDEVFYDGDDDGYCD